MGHTACAALRSGPQTTIGTDPPGLCLIGETRGRAALVGCIGVGAAFLESGPYGAVAACAAAAPAGAAGIDLEEGYSHYKQNTYEGD